MTAAKGPLAGVTVLDLTRVLAGPYCTMMMADQGARVIKVEIPGKGDDSRAFGPFKDGKSLYFASINRGKESISLNLKKDEGKKILKDLVAKVDVIIENYRPGTMEKLGLGYDVLKEINPRLIYAASSGFGHSGPDSTKPAYDILAQARGGVMSITGHPGGEPTRVGLSFGDLSASLFTAIGISSALYQRELTGQGQKIDVAMLDCQVALLENALVRYQTSGTSPGPLGTKHPTITPFQAVPASDRHFVIAVGNDALWKKFCDAVESETLLNDPRFATNPKRTENHAELEPLLFALFKDKPAQHWIDLLQAAGVPSAPINDVEHVMKDPQVLGRDMIVDMVDPDLGTIQLAGNPIKMTSIPETGKRGPAPKIGEQNNSIYAEMLGLDDAGLEQLKNNGVI